MKCTLYETMRDCSPYATGIWASAVQVRDTTSNAIFKPLEGSHPPSSSQKPTMRTYWKRESQLHGRGSLPDDVGRAHDVLVERCRDVLDLKDDATVTPAFRGCSMLAHVFRWYLQSASCTSTRGASSRASLRSSDESASARGLKRRVAKSRCRGATIPAMRAACA